jgi:hypothetical protein
MARTRIEGGGFVRFKDAYFPAWMLDNGHIPKPQDTEVNVTLVVVCGIDGAELSTPIEIVLSYQDDHSGAVDEWTRITGPDVLDITEIDDIDGI